ncbi:MAG: diguanylate cyclase domain-containing protein [Burkholderiaceae bacterium]
MPGKRTIADPDVVPSRADDALPQAVRKSGDAREKAAECVAELAALRRLLREEATVPHSPRIDEALAHAEHADRRTRDCTADLDAVDDALRRELEQRHRLESELEAARRALTDAEAREQHAARRALHDVATGLPNRALFNDRLTHALASARRHGWALAVMFIDLDRFKHVNDTWGHEVGDRVLQEVAERLSVHARSEDTVCRNGGDEFLYLLVGPRSDDDVALVARKTFDNIAAPMRIDDLEIGITPSIGIAMYPRHGSDGKTLIKNADAAMYRAKNRGTGFAFHATQRAPSL